VALAPIQCFADLPQADVLPGRGFFDHSTSRYHFLTLTKSKSKHKRKMPNVRKKNTKWTTEEKLKTKHNLKLCAH
jgi:hypothetical protein